MDFRCIEECAQCCIEREYYPNKKYGKIGVLLLPEEKRRIERLAEEKKLKITILPRIGISESEEEMPKILAHQLMGVESNGNRCPFLDIESGAKSTHGGFPCMIYDERPLACRAYPVIESEPITLDEKCKFCKEHQKADGNLNSEIESLVQIKEKMSGNFSKVWRFATKIGEKEDMNEIKQGWILEQ